jgi:hypothetical protein
MIEQHPALKETGTDGENLEDRRPYHKPEITHELELEVRTGSPIPESNPLDPLSDN